MMDEELERVVQSLCESKAEEFRLIGYEHVEAEEIWSCVSSKYQKNGQPALHAIVNDILSLKVTTFMNQMTLDAYRGSRF
ncbi:post-transcriptional regulator [Paenibacillus kobensis]|uniref:post-transcriptional regulator n=1 Tax=Paenibacillus kobensis TaxID=59841 RepID=UPI0013E2D47D|nr:post-transcriptional regulator [Paenibacillus kobensis]